MFHCSYIVRLAEPAAYVPLALMNVGWPGPPFLLGLGVGSRVVRSSKSNTAVSATAGSKPTSATNSRVKKFFSY